MVSQDDLPEIDYPFRLQRIPRTHDLLSLVSKPQQTTSSSRSSSSLRSRSSNGGSENGDALYMAMPRKQDRCNRSLSPISNNSTPRLYGPLEGDGACSEAGAIEDSAEKFSWDIIDREIYEWQYACRTGRPYWWLPKAKYMAHSKLGHETKSSLGAREINEHPEDEYNTRRRAVSDSFLADSNTVGDMAHIIAVQLLSSCFTLPPDLMVPASTQNCSMLRKKRSTSLSILESPMISSLRMHNRYRFSPCFGHQGRNNSPVQFTPGTHGDTTPSSPSPSAATGMQTPDIGTSDTLLRRRRVHRALHVTEGSATNCSLDSHTDGHLKFCSANANLEPAVGTIKRLPQQSGEDANSKNYDLSHMPGSQNEVGRNFTADLLEQDQVVASEMYHTRPKTKYELDLITQSEAHHDFMQPVKDIVVRRWQKMRRRLGSSQNSNGSRPGSEESIFAPGSRSSSPAVESDGRARRRRARASGDISSYESTPHYNSPVSSHFSATGSGASSPPQTDYGTLPSSPALVESLAAAISSPLENYSEDATLSYDHSFYNASIPLEPCLGCQPHNSQHGDQFSSVHSQSRVDTDHRAQTMLNSIALSPRSSTGRLRGRHKRKSMLSEVFTAEDLDDEVAISGNDNSETSISDALTSNLPSSKNETESHSNILLLDSDADVPNTATRRPILLRTSTSGTQIFSPGDEGVEIDGLPVGLCRHAWDGPGTRRERSYL